MRTASLLLSLPLVIGLAGAARANGTPTARLEVTASSTLAGKQDRYAPWRAVDGQQDTAWCEGRKDEGTGEALVLALGEPQRVAEMRVRAGFHKSDALFKKNNLPAKLEVVLDDGRTIAVDVPDARAEVTVPVGGAAVREVTIRFAAVTRRGMNDTCLSEVALVASGGQEIDLWVGVSAEAAAGLPAWIEEYERAVEGCDAATLAQFIAVPIKYVLDLWMGGKQRVSAKKPADLAKACREGAIPTPTGGVQGGWRPGTLLLDGQAGVAVPMMLIEWRGGRWMLVEI